MGRNLRIQIPGYYHVFNRANNRRSIHLASDTYQCFLSLLEYISVKFKLTIYAYCVMANHYHIVLKTTEDNLSRAFQEFGRIYSRHINQVVHGAGPTFESRYRSKYIDTDAYFLQVIRYVHLNPVEANIVDHPSEYFWSSFSQYLNEESSLIPVHDILGRFQNISEFDYYHEIGNSSEIKKFYANQRSSQIVPRESVSFK